MSAGLSCSWHCSCPPSLPEAEDTVASGNTAVRFGESMNCNSHGKESKGVFTDLSGFIKEGPICASACVPVACTCVKPFHKGLFIGQHVQPCVLMNM